MGNVRKVVILSRVGKVGPTEKKTFEKIIEVEEMSQAGSESIVFQTEGMVCLRF